MPEAYVFGDAIGQQVKDPKKAWARCCRNAGVTGLHFHDLRHEAASRLLERGMPLQDVQQQLGHASAQQTSTYCNTSLDHRKASVKRLKPDTAPSLHDVAHGGGEEPQPLVQPEASNGGNVLVN
jgi:integrase